MNIAISPIKNNVMKFRANKKDETKTVEKNKLSPLRLQEKNTKNIVGCFVSVMLVLDVLYFVMKRKFKNDSLNALRAEAQERANTEKLKDIYQLIKESPESFGPNAKETMDRLTKGIKPKSI